jgi:hypothetical protein
MAFAVLVVLAQVTDRREENRCLPGLVAQFPGRFSPGQNLGPVRCGRPFDRNGETKYGQAHVDLFPLYSGSGCQ